MANDAERFVERRRSKDRRDWDEFVVHDRRTGRNRRSGFERRTKQEVFIGPERRKLKTAQDYPYRNSIDLYKSYYFLNEVADAAQTSASDILEWIRENLIKDSRIKRDASGRRLFSRKDVERIINIKRYGVTGKPHSS